MTKKHLHAKPLRIGFLINPDAGAGGPAGHKGSDRDISKQAIQEGRIARRAPGRARQFVEALPENLKCTFVLVNGAMGSDAFIANDPSSPPTQSLCYLPDVIPEQTRREHTIAVSTCLLSANIDLLIFVGGDGTARDVCTAIGEKVPVLGVPSGVKMHSGVFAVSPLCAAKVLSLLVAGELVSLVEGEVRDIDESAFEQGLVKSRYFGVMWVPDELRYVQNVKQGGVEVDALVLDDIAAEIGERLADAGDSTLTIFAPGSTTLHVQHALGYTGTLLGVDVVLAGSLIAQDVDARQLDSLVSGHSGPVVIVLTAIGGQGHIIGRGNQQISTQVLKRVGRANVWVVATKKKLQALQARPLLMDSNDPELDEAWQGIIPVITGYRDQVLYRLGFGNMNEAST